MSVEMDRERERALLGALLLAPDELDAVAGRVRASDFTIPEHANLFGLFLRMRERGIPIDQVTVPEAIARERDIGRFGGMAYALGHADNVPSVANVLHYADTIREAADLAKVRAVVEQTGAEAAKPGISAAELRERALDQIGRLTISGADTFAKLGILTARQAADQWLERGENTEHFWCPLPGGLTEPPRAQTMPDNLNLRAAPDEAAWNSLHEIMGPWHTDQVAVLVGPTGRGKSAFAVQAAEAAATTRPDSPSWPVLYVSCEMGTDELLARMITVRAQETRTSIRNGGAGIAYSALLAHVGDMGFIRKGLSDLVARCPDLYLWAPRGQHRHAEGVTLAARAVAARHPGRPIFVVVDYLQRLLPPSTDDRRTATGDVSGILRDLSRPGGVPGVGGRPWPGAAVLALSSTARTNYAYFTDCESLKSAHVGGKRWVTEGEKRKEVSSPPVELVGLGKESGDIEYDAPTLLVMTTDQASESESYKPRNAYLAVVKNRHGRQGGIEWQWHPACGMFEDKPRSSPVSTDAMPYTPRGGRR